MFRRAWNDTVTSLGYRKLSNLARSLFLTIIALFLVWYIGGQTQMSAELNWAIASISAIGIVFIPTFAFHLARAPVFIKWENEKQPKVQAIPNAGRCDDRRNHEYLMWAEIRITNLSPSEPLQNVEVSLSECVTILEKQGQPNRFVYVKLADWNPSRVYWSIRDVYPAQFSTSLSPGDTKTALLAYNNDSNGGVAIFNTNTHPIVVGGAKISVKVSANNSPLWTGEFFIECHPNYFHGDTAKIELVEFANWQKTHNI